MVRSSLAVAGMTVATLGVFALSNANCGGTTNQTSSGSGGHSTSSTSSSSGTVTLSRPPPAGPTMPPTGTTNTVIAIDKLFIGDTDPDGAADMSNGWEYYGYNLDGVNPSNLAAFCKPVNNASPSTVHQEGNIPGHVGVENAFGHLILPIILGIESGASGLINADITGGKFTIMLSMQNLGTGAAYNPILTQLYAGGNLMGTPSFDSDGGIDQWPVLPDLLVDPTDITQGSKVQFPMSYLAGNTWVSGGMGTVTLSLTISGQTLTLNISNAVLSMELNEAHTSATNGIIAGVLSTSELTSQIQMVAGSIDPSLCVGPTIQSILSQIEEASDIMANGTQDPTQSCTGISIGLGFNGALVDLGGISPTTTSPANPCADAGG
jgi:hypothetical protein